MVWQIKFSATAKKQLSKLDQPAQKSILLYLKKQIGTGEDPQRYGTPLRENLSGLWKYRVGDYRLICEIQEENIVVLVLQVGHRRKVYGGH